ncbi:MAG: TadE/TadG family type IV pilus assembly protein [Paracoccaceae bacterium]
MIERTSKFLRQFGRNEDGQMVIEFALAIPLVFTLFLTSIELGIYSVRQMFLERGMDMTVRDIRLGTGQNLSHTQIKQNICSYAGFLPDCDSTLRLEMTSLDPRSFDSSLYGSADCVDVSQPVTPLRAFVHGNSHELMVLRACYMFKPVFPSTGLGYAYAKDGSGRSAMFSTSAFVQEPR